MKIRIKIPRREAVFAFFRPAGRTAATGVVILYRILKWPVLVATPLLIFGLAAWWSLISSLSSDIKSVPDLIDLLPREAYEKLAMRSLKLDISDQRKHSDIYVEGRIIDQSPAAGAKIKRERKVRVTLSAGFRKILVPSLIGMSLREAKLVAEQKGFKVRRGLLTHSDSVAPGSVIAQTPQPSTQMITEFIDVLESRGPRPRRYLLPAMQGMPVLPVLDFLRSRGIPVVVWQRGSTRDISGGDRFELRHYVIYRQSPAAGNFIAIPGSIEVILRVRRERR